MKTKLLRPYTREGLSYKTPIGDALLTARVAASLGADVECSGFIKDLLQLAGAPVQDETIAYDELIDLNPLSSLSQTVFDHPLSKTIWGTPEFYNKYGRMHITDIWAAILGTKPLGQLRIKNYDTIPEYQDKVLLVLGARQIKRMWKQWGAFTEYLYNKKIPYAFLPDTHSAQELVNILGSAKHLVTTFTGPMHIRAALDKPQTCLCVGDDPYLFAPLSDKADILWNGCSKCFYEPPRLQSLRDVNGERINFNGVTKCDHLQCQYLLEQTILSLTGGELDRELFQRFRSVPVTGSVVCRAPNGKSVVNELWAGAVTVTVHGDTVIFTETVTDRQAIVNLSQNIKGERK